MRGSAPELIVIVGAIVLLLAGASWFGLAAGGSSADRADTSYQANVCVRTHTEAIPADIPQLAKELRGLQILIECGDSYPSTIQTERIIRQIVVVETLRGERP